MINYLQETDSKIIFPLPSGLHYRQQLADETFGEKPFIYFFSPTESRLVKSALDALKNSTNRAVANEAEKLLFLLKEIVSSFQQLNFDLTFLPPIRAYNNDDGSILIEWVFKDYRIGFGVELNPADLGWYLVTKRELGEISASGYTSNTNLKTTILWLLNFIVSHS